MSDYKGSVEVVERLEALHQELVEKFLANVWDGHDAVVRTRPTYTLTIADRLGEAGAKGGKILLLACSAALRGHNDEASKHLLRFLDFVADDHAEDLIDQPEEA